MSSLDSETAILVTGGSGKLGRELVKVYPKCLNPKHSEFDITCETKVSKFIEERKPSLIIHTAALTGINQCETNRELAWKTNYLGTMNLVKACEKFSEDCYFVYISTACVFYGDRGNYSESDLPYPKNYYSLTKLLGESAVKSSSLEDWLIIRTNFVSREKWPYPSAFVDRFGTYLFADDLAEAIREVLEKRMKGTLHVCGEEKLSMFELAKITTPEVRPMTLKEYNGPPLTVDMSLVSERIKHFKLKRSHNTDSNFRSGFRIFH